MKTLLIATLLFPSICFAQRKADMIGYAPVLKAVYVDSEKMPGMNADSIMYTDKTLTVKWTYAPKEDEMSLSVKNNQAKSIKILWQESGYISGSGSIDRIFFGGLKFFGRYSEQLPTRVFSNTYIVNKLIAFSFEDEALKKVNMLAPPANSVWIKKEEYEADAAKRNFRIILLIDTGDAVKEYDFHFGAKVLYKN